MMSREGKGGSLRKEEEHARTKQTSLPHSPLRFAIPQLHNGGCSAII